MPAFLQALFHGTPLLLRSVAAMALAAVACGVVGTYVVVKRESYTVGAISHSLLGGIGAALFFAARWHLAWLTPWMGALAAALIAAALIAGTTTFGRLRPDTVLSAVWALGMAVGISFITAMPGYPPDLNSFLFGSILIVSTADLVLMAVLDLVILAVAWMWHSRFVTLAFDAELLQLRGISPALVNGTLQVLIALTVVLLSQIAGIVLCMALLILPVATAALLFRRLPRIMLAAAILCFLAAFLGVALSYQRWPGGVLLSPGATIIELAGAAYLATAAIRKLIFHRNQP